MLVYQSENEFGNLREIDRNLISNCVCALLETFTPPRSLNMEFGRRRRRRRCEGKVS
jgi:hypothetical protein